MEQKLGRCLKQRLIHYIHSRNDGTIKSLIQYYVSVGNRLSERHAYLRASSYYRTAEFFLHENPNDPRILETWQNSVDSFLKAADHFSHSFESVEIPYEGKTIPAYFYGASRSSSSPSRRPTLVVHTGFDGTQGELYSQCAVAALERGYNVITFEGPGQGRVLRDSESPK